MADSLDGQCRMRNMAIPIEKKRKRFGNDGVQGVV